MTKKTVVINGIVYDHRTGMPLRAERSTTSTHKRPAASVHVSLQKSSTLSRKYVRLEKKTPKVAAPKPAPQPVAPSITLKKQQRANAPTVHQKITRFAPRTKPAELTKKGPVISDIGPAPHRLTHAVAQKTTKPVARVVKPSQVLKQEALDKATAAMPSKRAKDVRAKKSAPKRRLASVASGAMALLLLGGYLTYLNMPALSTRVAAAQAGINATYPAYQPSGYSLSGPVAYQQGSVTMKFAANGGPQTFTVNQTKSGWDSSAVLENYVTPKAGDKYATDSVNGLTIYTYENNAAWINGGILYTISGNAPLSTDQVKRIATSM